MNLVDVATVVIFIGVFAGAFFAGFGRSLASLVALGAGLLAASAAYDQLGDQIARLLSPMSGQTADLLAFVLLMALVAAGTLLILLRSFAVSRLRTRLTLDMRGGLVSNVCVVLLAGVLSAFVVVVVVQICARTVWDLPTGGAVVTLRHDFAGSPMAREALRGAPYLYNGVTRVLPGAGPEILVPVPR